MKAYSSYGPVEGCTPRSGYVKLNGDTVWEGTWCKEGVENSRGVNILLIDRSTCSVQESRTFDTHFDERASTELSEYLDQVSGDINIVGVSADEAMKAMQAMGLRALERIGVDVSRVKERGSFGFVAHKDRPSETVLQKALSEEESNENPAHFTHYVLDGEEGATYCTIENLTAHMWTN